VGRWWFLDTVRVRLWFVWLESLAGLPVDPFVPPIGLFHRIFGIDTGSCRSHASGDPYFFHNIPGRAIVQGGCLSTIRVPALSMNHDSIQRPINTRGRVIAAVQVCRS
jgi:hypothetical protein